MAATAAIALLLKIMNKLEKVLYLEKDAVQLLRELEHTFQGSCFISSSFQDIVDSKLDKRNRTKQLHLILFITLIGIPVYSFQCILDLIPEERRAGYQHIPNVNGQLGPILGQMIDFAAWAFMIKMTADMIIMRRAEKRNRLEFLTDLRSLTDGRIYFELNKLSTDNLLSKLRWKILCFRNLVPVIVWNSNGIIFFLLVMFLYRQQPSFLTSCVAISFNTLTVTLIKLFADQYFMTCFSYIIMTDCLTARIQSVIDKIENPGMEEFVHERMKRILNNIESIVETVHKYNITLRPLLRNLIIFFRTGICSLLVILSLDVNPAIKTFILFASSTTCLMLIVTGVYTSLTKSKLKTLYTSLNSRYVNTFSGSRARELSIKLHFQTRPLIKELGIYDKDGHFVLGFADGDGPEITSLEIQELTFDTVFNSMIVLGLFK